jgi:hypothetical protein
LWKQSKETDMEKVVGQVVRLDDVEHEDKEFEGCTIVYAGTGKVLFRRCGFVGCRWAFEGHAAATLKLMAGIYKTPGGGRQLIENTFDQIRGKAVKGPTLQ